MTHRDDAGLDIYDYNTLTDAKEEVIEVLKDEHETLLNQRYATAIKLVTHKMNPGDKDIWDMNQAIEQKEDEIESAENELKALQDARFALALKVAR